MINTKFDPSKVYSDFASGKKASIHSLINRTHLVDHQRLVSIAHGVEQIHREALVRHCLFGHHKAREEREEQSQKSAH